MPLRDLLLAGVILGALPVCLVRPWIGVLLWCWLGFMSPHRLSWGFAYDMEFAQLVAIATLLGFLFTKDRRPLPAVRESALLIAFWAVTLVSTVLAMYPDAAWPDFKRFSKILLMTFLMIMLAQSRERLRYLLLVAGLSIGFYGVKGSFWTFATGGESGWVLGPEGSFIGDNNGLALGLIMIVPLLYFLARDEPRRWLRGVLQITLVMSITAVPFTYSRAGFLGLVVVLFMLVRRTRWKWLAITTAAAASPLALSLLPQRWFDRISTILTYSEDGSAISRLTAWGVSWGVALDNPLFGGGFRVLPHPEVWAAYAPDWTGRAYNAHSIYFEVLGEHGFIGFLLFFGLLGSTLISMRAVRRQVTQRADLRWLVNYSYMVETGLLAYLVAGAFYNLASFDLVYFLVGVAIILKRFAADALTATTLDAPASPSAQVTPRLPRPAARWQPIST